MWLICLWVHKSSQWLYICFWLFWFCKLFFIFLFFFLMIRRPPRSTLDRSSAASDVYKRQVVVNPKSNFTFCVSIFCYIRIKSNVFSSFEIITSWGFFDRQNSNFFLNTCLLYTSPSPRDRTRSRMPSSAWKKKTIAI